MPGYGVASYAAKVVEDVKVEGTTAISKGQELNDLQRALKAGAITQSEYDSLRAKIMRRAN